MSAVLHTQTLLVRALRARRGHVRADVKEETLYLFEARRQTVLRVSTVLDRQSDAVSGRIGSHVPYVCIEFICVAQSLEDDVIFRPDSEDERCT